MSNEAVIWAQNEAPIGDLKEWAALSVLAGRAGPDGCDAFPAVMTIARQTTMSERSVQRALDSLKAKGLIREGDQSAARYLRVDRKPVVYDLMIPYDWFPNVERVNAERIRMGRAPLTRADRPDFAGRQDVTPEEPVVTGHGVPGSPERGDTQSFAGCQGDTRTIPLNRSEGTGNTLSADASGEKESGVLPEELEKRVAELCGRLADLVKVNGAKRPKITYAWRDAARGMITGEDPYTFDQVWGGIEWAQADAFWASRTTTMAKLAKHFDQIIIQARMRTKDTSTVEGKQAQQDVTRKRMRAMGEFMAAFEERYGRPMDDREQKDLLARLKEEVR